MAPKETLRKVFRGEGCGTFAEEEVGVFFFAQDAAEFAEGEERDERAEEDEVAAENFDEATVDEIRERGCNGVTMEEVLDDFLDDMEGGHE